MIVMLLAEGFEEIEAIAPLDILRRAGLQVITAGIGGAEITGAHGICVRADARIEDIAGRTPDMIILPGGSLGVKNLGASEKARALIVKCANAGKYVAAICAAPTLLAEMGLLENRHAVCYPTVADQMSGVVYCGGEQVVQDGKFITAEAAGVAIEFGLKLAEVLKGWDGAEKVREGICFTSHIRGLD